MVCSTLQSYRKYARRTELLTYLGFLFRCPLLSPVAHFTTVIMLLVIQFGACCAIINFFLDATDISVIASTLAPMCSTATTMLKVICFTLKRKDVKELDDTVKALFNLEVKHDTRRPTLLSLLLSFERLTNLYLFLHTGIWIAYNIPPVISVIYQNVRHIEPKSYHLSLPLKFPWDFNRTGLIYQLHYMFQLCTCLPLYFVNAAADTLFGFYMFHMAGVFKTMSHRLQNPEVDESRILLLRSCAKKHKLLLRCRDIIQDIYWPIIVSMVLTNCVAMCALIFQALQTELTLKSGIMQVTYFFVKFVQINLYTWCGTVMTTESERFAQSVYLADWVDKSTELKNDMIVTMIQRPLIVKAAGFCHVSMDLVPKLINTTLSYYFLLKTLNESEQT